MSESLPKYPLLSPAVASASPSRIPIKNTENPIELRNAGMMGYSISLAISVVRLIMERIQTVREMCFKTIRFMKAN